MSGSQHSTYTPKTGIERWFDARMPLPRLIHDSFVTYPVPRNLNYMTTCGRSAASCRSCWSRRS